MKRGWFHLYSYSWCLMLFMFFLRDLLTCDPSHQATSARPLLSVVSVIWCGHFFSLRHMLHGEREHKERKILILMWMHLLHDPEILKCDIHFIWYLFLCRLRRCVLRDNTNKTRSHLHIFQRKIIIQISITNIAKFVTSIYVKS
jgi:hypothetical protein